MTNFIEQSIEQSQPLSGTPEASRRYIQWKDEDVRQLLSDLEQPGHYDKWKQNKSGYSKRVAEEVFNSIMYHEAIKFKVRWLESRFKNWHKKLTAPGIIHDKQAIANARDKMMKEFPYYDRCKGVFDTNVLPDEGESSSKKSSPLINSKMENFHMAQEPSSPILNRPKPEVIIAPEKRVPIGSQSSTETSPNINSSFPALKKRKIQPYTTRQTVALSSTSLQQQTQTMDIMVEDRKIRLLELELEGKKMDHEERMQHMKLEQLRLEIELQKLKTYSTNPSD